jgi:hypothetical protein
MEHNTKYGTQQQFSQQANNKTKTTNGTEHKETTTRQEREHKQEMGTSDTSEITTHNLPMHNTSSTIDMNMVQ